MGSARYTAFLSYSHKDAAQARWLHRRLEAYRIPRRLVGSEGERGPVPARLTPIFRDREELPAAGDLSEKVRQALAASDNLIVLCSPSSAASPWVAKEIEAFRDLHPDRPILAAIVDGEPGESFPAALARDGVEPLAADLRRDRDGRRLGFLKLVAGLTGVGLDSLAQRDAQRKLRRVTAVTAAALAAMLIMAAMTVVALTSRAEAEHQRAEAEGLVEFMLTDLRDRLEGVGRLDVLTSVNHRALGYYQRQDLKTLTVSSLERRARILHAMGEDDEKRGETGRALRQFSEAARTTSALLQAQPRDPERIFAHSQSEYWVGLIAWRRNDIQAAEASFKRYAALANQLVEIDRSKPEWLLEAGYAESNLGTLLLKDRADARAAEKHFRAALGWFLQAARRQPDPAVLWDIADAHAWLAGSYRAQRKYPGARDQRARQLVILRRLEAQDPKNFRYARGFLSNSIGLAQIDLETGRPSAARERLGEAYSRAEQLRRRDPDNAEIEKQKTVIGLLLAKAMLAEPGRSDSAKRQEAVRFMNGCAAPAVRADMEILGLCHVLGKKIGPPLPPGFVSQSPTQTPGRLSPRWGFDFAAELKSLH